MTDQFPIAELLPSESAARVASVLVEADEPMTQQEIADQIDRSQSVISRYADELLMCGAVEKHGNDGYVLDENHPIGDTLIGLHHAAK